MRSKLKNNGFYLYYELFKKEIKSLSKSKKKETTTETIVSLQETEGKTSEEKIFEYLINCIHIK